ncbi:hypothetical protein [Mesorhizobium sp. WSM2561]|uniref:hypothetical protein n=1 Tax=Mesorhizobium sp. WSM2561 TaxID=1040985 RepID=UPI000482A8DB|nr:hypothetical protein [Mesorhizobium sp. WSM2561]
MEILDLPFVGTQARLNDVVDLMKERGRSGVLLELPSGPQVLDIDIILYTLRTKGNVEISQVGPRFTTIELPGSRSARKWLSTAKAVTEAEEFMDAHRAIYAVSRVVRKYAEVLARHETYVGLGSRPTIWRCRQNPDHVWLTGQLRQPGQKCRDDNSDVDPI